MSKPKKICIIDDDTDIGNMLKMILEFRNYEVMLLTQAGKVEELLHGQQIDLIILDMLLSGQRGEDVCRKLKNNSTLSSIPILMISALAGGDESCRSAGADDFIAKPFEMKDVLEKVERLTGEAS